MRRSTFPGLFVSDEEGEGGEAQWPGGDPVFKLLVHSSRDLLPPPSTQFADPIAGFQLPTLYSRGFFLRRPPPPTLLPANILAP